MLDNVTTLTQHTILVLSVLLVVFAYTVYVAFIFLSSEGVCISLFLFKVYKADVYGLVNCHKIPHEVYIHVMNTQIKKTEHY